MRLIDADALRQELIDANDKDEYKNRKLISALYFIDVMPTIPARIIDDYRDSRRMKTEMPDSMEAMAARVVVFLHHLKYPEVNYKGSRLESRDQETFEMLLNIINEFYK